jgi:hypothetical protein
MGRRGPGYFHFCMVLLSLSFLFFFGYTGVNILKTDDSSTELVKDRVARLERVSSIQNTVTVQLHTRTK